MINEQAKNGFVIAIDGPAASGKGTIVQLITQLLHGVNLYTGGMYRALALKCIKMGVPLEDKEQVLALLSSSQIELGEDDMLNSQAHILLDGEDVTQKIRMPDVSLGAGKVVRFEEVRDEMVKRQRVLIDKAVSLGRIVVVDGQDTAKYVYPLSQLKIFLTASQEERAKRRQNQYIKQGLEKSLEEVIEEIKIRDKRDWSRHYHPLSADPEKDGYVVVDSTRLTPDETKDKIVTQLKIKGLYD